MVDTIYKQAILEGVATTFADTENIIEGGKVNNMTSEDILKIVNLKHVWEFILNKNVILSNTNFYCILRMREYLEACLVPISATITKFWLLGLKPRSRRE